MIKNKIKKLIKEASTDKGVDITNKTDLITNEILDSFSTLVLISSIEKEFSIKINMNQLDIEKFKTINSIEKLIKKYG